jgi:hypothetical protein
MSFDVIGIHGSLGSGKDTVANIIQLIAPNAYERYAFAKPLKDAVRAMFGFTDKQLEDRILKEEVDPQWGFSPRRAIQLLGTEYGRNMLRDDIWIKRAELELLNNRRRGYATIITDVRFDNEAAWIKSHPNSLLIYVQAPELVRDEKYNHESENGIAMEHIDIMIVNQKSEGLAVLHEKVKRVICVH